MIDIRVLENRYSEEYVVLLKKAGQHIEGADYTDFFPWVLGAFKGEKLVGAIQVCQGKPIGRVEMLAVDPDLDPPEKARMVRALCYNSAATLKRLGSSIMMSIVPFKLKAYKKALMKRGAQQIDQGNVLAWRL